MGRETSRDEPRRRRTPEPNRPARTPRRGPGHGPLLPALDAAVRRDAVSGCLVLASRPCGEHEPSLPGRALPGPARGGASSRTDEPARLPETGPPRAEREDPDPGPATAHRALQGPDR